MNKSISILWGLSIGAAFTLGVLSQDVATKHLEQKHVSAIPLNNKKENTIVETVKVGTDSEQSVTGSSIDVENVQKEEKHSVAKQLEKAFSGGYMSADYASIAKAYLLIENLTENELINLFNEITTGQDNDSKINIISLILSRLSSINPLEALTLIESRDLSVQSNTIAMSTILTSWAKVDPLSTLDWYMNTKSSNFEGRVKTSSLASIFYGLANKDKIAAFDKLAELSNGFEKTIAIAGLSLTFESADEYETFLSYSSELDDKSIKQKLLRSWGQKHPKDAILWVEQIESVEEKHSSQLVFYQSWSNSSPSEAADWFINTANEDERKNALVSKVVEDWAFRNPKAAMNWLEVQPNINSEEHKANLLDKSVYVNTEFAIEHLSTLSDEKNKLELSSNIYRHLVRNKSAKAEQFLLSSEYKEELKK